MCIRDSVDIVAAVPRTVLDIRRRTLGFVSQFLRVIPRVSTLDIVRDPLLARGATPETATERAKAMLARLNLPERLWNIAPATFSGGEQQRVNIARSFVDPSAIMLIDEPTASLDAANRDVVVELIAEARAAGSAIVGIFHDEAVRERVATRYLDITASVSYTHLDVYKRQPYTKWNEVNPAFPAWDIAAYIPGEKHGTREVFETKLLDAGCDKDCLLYTSRCV